MVSVVEDKEALAAVVAVVWTPESRERETAIGGGGGGSDDGAVKAEGYVCSNMVDTPAQEGMRRGERGGR